MKKWPKKLDIYDHVADGRGHTISKRRTRLEPKIVALVRQKPASSTWAQRRRKITDQIIAAEKRAGHWLVPKKKGKAVKPKPSTVKGTLKAFKTLTEGMPWPNDEFKHIVNDGDCKDHGYHLPKLKKMPMPAMGAVAKLPKDMDDFQKETVIVPTYLTHPQIHIDFYAWLGGLTEHDRDCLQHADWRNAANFVWSRSRETVAEKLKKDHAA